MGFLSKLFGRSSLSLKKEDIKDFDKVGWFLADFIKQDKLMVQFLGRTSNIIFDEGYRPITGASNNPEAYNSEIKDLAGWFITKVFIDLDMLINVNQAGKEEFREFLDLLGEKSSETLQEYGTMALKYNFETDNYVFENEIQKIPVDERSWFKINFLSDNVLSAELRVLAWLYHEYYGEWYKSTRR